MKKAFTLLELLAIVSVLVILIGIVIPRFKGLQDKGRITQAKAELQTIQTAIESYYLSQSPKQYPPSSATLEASYLIHAVPQILNTAFYDPFGQNSTMEYNYFRSPNEKYYVISSVGPNGESGISGISDYGVIIGKDEDDLCVTNGSGC